jgi:hypothetical protein
VAAVEVVSDAKALYYLFTQAAMAEGADALVPLPTSPFWASKEPNAFMLDMRHADKVPWLFTAVAAAVALALEGLGVGVASLVETRQRRIFMRQHHAESKKD